MGKAATIPELCKRLACYSWIWSIIIAVAQLRGCVGTGVFPPVQSLATGKPIATNGTCTSQRFCDHTSESWPSGPCQEVVCDDSCPGATSLPRRTVLGQLPRTSTAASQTPGNIILFNGGYLRYAASNVPSFNSTQGFSLSIMYLPISDV